MQGKIQDLQLQFENKTPIQVKAAFWFVICNFLVKGISFITAPLFTRVLSTEDYGTVAIFSSYQQVILIFATLELSLGAYTKGYLKFKDRIAEFTSNLVVLSNVVTIICFIVFIFFKNIFFRLTGVSFVSVLLMFVLFLVQPSYQCWMYRKRYNYEYKKVVILTIMSSAASALFPLTAVMYVHNSAETKIVSTLAVGIVFALPFYVTSLFHGGIVRDKGFFAKTSFFCLKFQLPLVMHSLSFLILGQSDRMMIGWMVNKSAAGIYSVAYSLATVVSIFQSSMNQVFQPYRYQKMEAGDVNAIKNTTNSLLLVFAGLNFCFILIAPEVIKLLFPSDFYEAVWVIPPVSVGIYFAFLYSVFVDVESYYEKTKYVMYASLVCAVMNIILNYFGIGIFGYIACAYSTLISYILFAVMHYIFMKKTCSDRDIKEKYFDIKVIVLISIVFTASGIGLSFLYQKVMIRYIILTVICAVVFINRKIIIRLFNVKLNEVQKR